MEDSLIVAATQILGDQPVSDPVAWVNIVTAIAMAVIAAFDIILTIIIFIRSRKDSMVVEDNHRKFELMHSLILEHNMSRLYEFYDKVQDECSKLLESDEEAVKIRVNSAVKSEAKKFRLRFLTLFDVVDSDLYKALVGITDALVDGITKTILDSGIKLTYEPKFDEEICQKISRNRAEMLYKLYHMS